MQAASHCCLLGSGQKGESEALAKVGPSQGCILVRVSVLAEQCVNIFKKLLTPSSAPDSPFKLRLKDLLAARKDSSGSYLTPATMNGVQKCPAQQRIWDTCQPEKQS